MAAAAGVVLECFHPPGIECLNDCLQAHLVWLWTILPMQRWVDALDVICMNVVQCVPLPSLGIIVNLDQKGLTVQFAF